MNSFADKSLKIIDFKAQNTCFSIFSLYQSLMLLMYAGQKDQAIVELSQILQQNQDQIYKIYQQLEKDETIQLAANIFDKYTQTIHSSFKDLMNKQFNFQPEKLISVKQVNNWCAKHTNNKIDQIINQITFDTLIISAIYFKDDWELKFNSQNTQEQTFNGFKGKTQKKLMRQKIKHAQYFENEQIQALTLQYKKSTLKAVIILPKSDKQTDFDAALLNGIQNLQNISYSQCDVILKLPQFKIESTFMLKEGLKQLNINKIFNQIDCTQTLGKQLQVDEIIQKTYINVDESGTTAAAVTGIMMLTACAGHIQIVKQMYCDHPFWFLLVDQDNNIIFTSSIVE